MSRTYRKNWTSQHAIPPEFATDATLQHRDGCNPKEIHEDPVGGWPEIWDQKNKRRAKRRKAKWMRQHQERKG